MSGDKQAVVPLALNLIDPCPTTTFSFQSSPFKNATYVLRDIEQVQPWQDSDLYTLETLVDCGPIKVEFFNSDFGLTALDPDLFSSRQDPSVFLVKETEIEDKVGVYPIVFRVSLTLYT